MVNDITTTCHVKHIDIRYKYVKEYVEDGTVKTSFIKSAMNDNNIITKTYIENCMRSIQERC